MTDHRQVMQQALDKLTEYMHPSDAMLMRCHPKLIAASQTLLAALNVPEANCGNIAAAPQAKPVAYPAPAADLVRDAERYRWLRDTNLDLSIRSDTEHLAPLQVPVIYIGHPAQQWNLGGFASAYVGDKFDQAIDAAIDAAMKGADHE